MLVQRPGLAAEDTRLLLASAEGFTDELIETAAGRPDVLIVDPDRLYFGD